MVTQKLLAETDEQKELRDSVRRMLRDRAPLERLREKADGSGGFDRELWRRIAGELGLVALPIPEEYDGLGQTALETHVVFEEMGRALYDGPYLATVGLAVPALLLAGDEAAWAEHLPGIAAGETIATLSVHESEVCPDGAPGVATTARRDGDGWRLTGTKIAVPHGAEADLLLVTARDGDQVSLFAVRGDADGVTRGATESLDLARALATVTLDGASATLVGTPGSAPALVEQVLDRALVSLAAEQAGGAAACLERSVEYAKTRQQFGKVIGSYQAVSHKLVDMLHRVEFSRATARYAAAAQAEGDAEFPVASRVAAAYCGEAFRWVASETIQAHGGIGFTWEHDAHLYYRRAWSAQHLLAGPDSQYAAVADRLGV